MAAIRRRNLARRRRRDEDEDEMEGSVVSELIDDSQSDISVPSDIDEDADADDSDLSEMDGSEVGTTGRSKTTANGATKNPGGHHGLGTQPTIVRSSPTGAAFPRMTDTEAMMNGLRISEEAAQEDAMDFEAAAEAAAPKAVQAPAASTQLAGGKLETSAERRRREHEEYKKKRDSDPAFIPNRGAFFMHDQRTSPGPNGFKSFGRGRGSRIRGIGGPYSPATLAAKEAEATNGPWAHDLHDSLMEAGHKEVQAPKAQEEPPSDPPLEAKELDETPKPPPAVAPAPAAPVVNRSFSQTTQIGTVHIRVCLPGMKAPISFSAVPVRQHTKLPNHRPPLRRDKPVRISLPDQPPRYIFPATERSFIFIPRALRPNQQGFGRGRGRGFGSYGGFSSRRTSAYGGSVYSPSIPLSRRSSLAREIARENIVSPAASTVSRPPGVPVESGRPIVRLPPGAPQSTATGTPHSTTTPVSSTPITNMPQPQTYPLPQKPTFRENWPAHIPMHQPKPQKAVSVAGIESPASLTFHAPPTEQQPFHQQVPASLNGSSTEGTPYYPPGRQVPAFPAQTSGGTPLSNIPERAIHAQPFQPYQQPGYPPQPYAAQPQFYYQPVNGTQAQYPGGLPPNAVIAPMFVQDPQQTYVLPAITTVAAPPTTAAAAQSGMVAHEANGMVFYYNPSQLYPPVEGYTQGSYAVPGVGGMMTPGPEGYYYQVPPGAVYYPQQ